MLHTSVRLTHFARGLVSQHALQLVQFIYQGLDSPSKQESKQQGCYWLEPAFSSQTLIKSPALFAIQTRGMAFLPRSTVTCQYFLKTSSPEVESCTLAYRLPRLQSDPFNEGVTMQKTQVYKREVPGSALSVSTCFKTTTKWRHPHLSVRPPRLIYHNQLWTRKKPEGACAAGERHLGTVHTITSPSINLHMTGSKIRDTQLPLVSVGDGARVDRPRMDSWTSEACVDGWW